MEEARCNQRRGEQAERVLGDGETGVDVTSLCAEKMLRTLNQNIFGIGGRSSDDILSTIYFFVLKNQSRANSKSKACRSERVLRGS